MSIAQHLAVIRNPFSTATTGAKIPDAAVSTSIGCRRQSSTQVTSYSGSQVFMLYPGLNSGLITYKRNTSDTDNPASFAFTYSTVDTQFTLGTPIFYFKI